MKNFGANVDDENNVGDALKLDQTNEGSINSVSHLLPSLLRFQDLLGDLLLLK